MSRSTLPGTSHAHNKNESEMLEGCRGRVARIRFFTYCMREYGFYSRLFYYYCTGELLGRRNDFKNVVIAFFTNDDDAQKTL